MNGDTNTDIESTPIQALVVTFPTGDRFSVPPRIIAEHRASYYAQRDYPNNDEKRANADRTQPAGERGDSLRGRLRERRPRPSYFAREWLNPARPAVAKSRLDSEPGEGENDTHE